jgi:hypothetical protein
MAMSFAATVLHVPAKIVPFNTPLRASFQVHGRRRLKQCLADLVQLALVPLARSNIRRVAYFLRRSTEDFRLLRP